MTISFLKVAEEDSPGVARSSMEEACLELGGQVEERHGFAIIRGFGDPVREESACRNAVGLAETTAGRKLELLAAPGHEDSLAGVAAKFVDGVVPSHAERFGKGWWCTYSARRALLLTDPAVPSGQIVPVAEAFAEVPGISAIEVSSALASVTLAGPLARDAIARFSALDLRPSVSSPGDFHPGSLARVPGAILHEGADRFRLIFGWAYGEHVWSVAADAIDGLGGSLVGVGALPPVDGREGGGSDA